MTTKASRSAARFMMAPTVTLLLGWMLVPLVLTLWFSFTKYLPVRGDRIEKGLDWVGFDNYVRFFSSSSFWPSDRDDRGNGRQRSGHHSGSRDRTGAHAGPAGLGAGGRARSDYLSVLRHAHRVGAGLEEYDDGPGQRHLCPPVALLRRRADRLASGHPARIDRIHRFMAVAAVRDPDPADGDPIAGQRSAGGGRNGRRLPDPKVHSHLAAASWHVPSPS